MIKQLFYQPSYSKLANTLVKSLGLHLGKYSFERFNNQEAQIVLQDNVNNIECFILGSFAPPESNILEMLMLAHTLKKEGAVKVTAIIPYLSYARQDKNEPYKSHASSLLAELSVSAGMDQIITIDAHSNTIADLYRLPLVSLSPAKIFAKLINEIGLDNLTLVAPDEGANERLLSVANELKGSIESLCFKKKRDGNIVTSFLDAQVKSRVVMIDDILDTGGSLVSACKILKEKNVKEIYIIVTHGIFSTEKWKELFDYGVKKIYITDSISNTHGKHDLVEVIALGSIIEQYLTTKIV